MSVNHVVVSATIVYLLAGDVCTSIDVILLLTDP